MVFGAVLHWFMLINNILKLSYLPKISLYLPIYNKQEYITESIRSIQKQTLKELEIIAVNDYSTDNSLKILKKLAKEDLRIKIINNDNNRGLLYTRAMGIINSSGEYLMNVDPDDILNGKNCLQKLYNIANLYNVEVITFSFFNKNKNYLKCSSKNKKIKQPLLMKSAYYKNNINDEILWNKLVKKKLMLKVYMLFKKKIYNNKWNYGEDTIWSILINKYAESKICINETIYIYNENDDSLKKNNLNIIHTKNKIYYLEMNFKIFKDITEQNYIISNILLFISYIARNKNNYLVISLIKKNSEIKKKLLNILIVMMRYYRIPFIILKKFKEILLFIK
jgi:glycosyltransferase involved in cell wall biosynthesis